MEKVKKSLHFFKRYVIILFANRTPITFVRCAAYSVIRSAEENNLRRTKNGISSINETAFGSRCSLRTPDKKMES